MLDRCLLAIARIRDNGSRIKTTNQSSQRATGTNDCAVVLTNLVMSVCNFMSIGLARIGCSCMPEAFESFLFFYPPFCVASWSNRFQGVTSFRKPLVDLSMRSEERVVSAHFGNVFTTVCWGCETCSKLGQCKTKDKPWDKERILTPTLSPFKWSGRFCPVLW